jgi:hypothetical protein
MLQPTHQVRTAAAPDVGSHDRCQGSCQLAPQCVVHKSSIRVCIIALSKLAQHVERETCGIRVEPVYRCQNMSVVSTVCQHQVQGYAAVCHLQQIRQSGTAVSLQADLQHRSSATTLADSSWCTICRCDDHIFQNHQSPTSMAKGERKAQHSSTNS